MTPTLEQLLERVAELIDVAHDDGWNMPEDAGLVATLRAHLAPAQPALFHANTLGYVIATADHASQETFATALPVGIHSDGSVRVFDTLDQAQAEQADHYSPRGKVTIQVAALVPLTEFDR